MQTIPTIFVAVIEMMIINVMKMKDFAVKLKNVRRVLYVDTGIALMVSQHILCLTGGKGVEDLLNMMNMENIMNMGMEDGVVAFMMTLVSVPII